MERRVSRREFLKSIPGLIAGGVVLSSCGEGKSQSNTALAVSPTQPEAPTPTAAMQATRINQMPTTVPPTEAPTTPPTATVDKPTHVPTETPMQETQLQLDGSAVRSTEAEKTEAFEALQATYAYFTDKKNGFVTAEGAPEGAMRVVVHNSDPAQEGKTVSEGIGLAMFAAVLTDNPEDFAAFSKYRDAHLNDQGNMIWSIDPDGQPSYNEAIKERDHGSATDGDEYAAMAYVLASKKWGTYGDKAKETIDNIMATQIEKGTFVVKPGEWWGGSDVTNLTYALVGFYPAFAVASGDENWLKVQEKAFKIIANVNEKSGAGETGKLPDWTKADGTPADGMSYDYGWDAQRATSNLAYAAALHNDEQAIVQLQKINAQAEKVTNVTNLPTITTLDGKQIGDNPGMSPLFMGAYAAAAIVSENQAYRTAILNALAEERSGYYDTVAQMYALGAISGEVAKIFEKK